MNLRIPIGVGHAVYACGYEASKSLQDYQRMDRGDPYGLSARRPLPLQTVPVVVVVCSFLDNVCDLKPSALK